MWFLLQELNTDIIKDIEIDDNSKVNDDYEDEGNSNSSNDDSVIQLQLQSDQNEYNMEDVILNDQDMLSNEVFHIEWLAFICIDCVYKCIYIRYLYYCFILATI